MKKVGQGLGQDSATEFAFQPGARVTMPSDVHPLEGVVTDVEIDDAGARIIYVRPWGGQAKPYRLEELTLLTGRSASTIDRFLKAVPLGSTT